jgi:8-oxo-dGTP pyrophosphatase MutT (NUDIX family)
MEDYIPYLRKMIGHAKCLSVGVSALIINKKGRILLEKRKDNGLYCLPGGSVDYEEKVNDALKREVFEETGISLQNPTLFAIRSGKDTTIHYPNDDITNYVVLSFISYLDEEPLPHPHDQESTEVFFCEIENLPPKEAFLGDDTDLISKFLLHHFEVSVD